jgi:hypothetical protein
MDNNNKNKIIEIDITKQARVLALLRLTDYALVILCGILVIGIVSELIVAFTSADASATIILVIGGSILSFAAFTGWRHVGVIDPKVWSAYAIVFPLLIVLCFFVIWGLLLNVGSLSEAFDQERRVETIQQFAGLFNVIWIGSVSVLGWLSLFALRKLKIVGLGPTVDEVMSRLASKGGNRAELFAHVKPINRRRGLALGVAGVVVLLAVVMSPMPGDKAWAETWLRSGQQISLLGFFLLVRARRYFQADADSVLAVDRRPPILFLRSFEDDEKHAYAGSDKALLDFSLETRLSNHFSLFGPFIAIGSPKEKVPQLGAARVLLSDDEWQPRVLGWMQAAQLIVMYSGKTHWVNWELRQVLNNGCATRLILMIPEIKAWRTKKREKEISARVTQVRDVFQSTPWEEELMQFDDFAGLRAMLFCPDGSMVMVKSRSRSRDAYHLAALISHQLLLDPTGATQPDSPRECVQKGRSIGILVTGVTAAIALAVGLIFLFTPNYGNKLTFRKGELYYQNPVSQDDAGRVGEYLVACGFFSDEKSVAVQLAREDDVYRLRFVINPKSVDDPLANIIFGVMGSEIARDLLAGGPIEVALADEHLKPIKVVPGWGKLPFGKGELYFSDRVGPILARNVGQLLVQSGLFNDQKEASVFLGKEQDGYELRFVVDTSHPNDPEFKSAFTRIGQTIAARALGGRPVMIHLCDSMLNPLTSDRVESEVNALTGL